MKKLIMFTMLMGVLACNKESVEYRQHEITKLEYTVEIVNSCTTVYKVKNGYFDIEVAPQQNRTIIIKDTYDNIKGFYINYKAISNNYINQYTPTRNDRTRVFKMEIGGVAKCQ